MSQRLENAIQVIKDHGLDGVLFATGPLAQYLSETTGYFWQRACMNNIAGSHQSKLLPETLLYVSKDGDRTIITIPQYRNSFPNIKVIPSYMDQFEDTLSTVIKGKKIGIGNDCEQFLKDTLHEIDSSIEYENAEHYFDDMRAIKDANEIKQMRKLAKFTDDAVMYCVNYQ